MNELERILNLAGVSYEAPKKIEETTEIAEEQSEAQKKAFADMLAKKKGKKGPTTDHEEEHVKEDAGRKPNNYDSAPGEQMANKISRNKQDDADLEQEYQNNRQRKKRLIKDLISNNPASEFSHMYKKEETDLDEAPNEGNEFSGELKKAKDAGKDEFEVGGKKYKVEAIDEAEDPDYSKDNLDICDKCDEETKDCECDDVKESLEVVEESPTMDTTQLITLLKNSGISEDQIANRLKVIEEEFGNTPEGVGETEPTVHGSDDNYNFAQAVNLSLKRYLDAADMKVQVSEHTKEDLTAKYLASKK
tara:strand:+ start:4804 stop:5718 length:915 start_codon:yes stop_codon:yes gene_type:complete